MKIRYDNMTATDSVIYFDHVNGEVRVGQQTVGHLPPGSPLRSLQGWLHARGEVAGWLGNRVSDLRYWLWRLSR